MCDYSLTYLRNRLAKDGEELVTHRFGEGTLGMISSDCQPIARKPTQEGFWSKLKEIITAPDPPSPVVVCIPPGAALLLQSVPERLQKELGIGSTEPVTFTQITAESHRHRDAIRLSSGREVLLQRLCAGLRVRVLSTAPAELETETRVQHEATEPRPASR